MGTDWDISTLSRFTWVGVLAGIYLPCQPVSASGSVLLDVYCHDVVGGAPGSVVWIGRGEGQGQLRYVENEEFCSKDRD